MLDIIRAVRHSRAEAPVGLMPTFKICALSESSGRGRQQDILVRQPTAANDNHLASPLIPFPENLLV